MVVIHPFQNAPVKNTGADAAAKHHRRPRSGFEFDVVFGLAQFDVADIGTANIGNEYQREHAEGQISAAQFVGDERFGSGHPIGALFGKDHQGQGNGYQDKQRTEKGEFVDTGIGGIGSVLLEIFIGIKHPQVPVGGGGAFG